MTTIGAKLQRWHSTVEENGVNFNDLHKFIIFRKNHSYKNYLPIQSGPISFEKRLENWINNFTEDEWQKELLKLVPQIIFIGNDEFNSLYRAAYRENIARWLMDCYNINPLEENSVEALRQAAAKTWFCSATDSMNLADFCHINNIPCSDYKTSIRSALCIGSSDKIEEMLDRRGKENIVILEDFVGSGSQVTAEVIYLANELSKNRKTLFSPLILCAQGEINILDDIKMGRLETILDLSPVMVIPAEMVVTAPDGFYSSRLLELIKEAANIGQFSYPFDGYKNTGIFFVMYSNCPDNTVPMLHENTASWEALFPRSERS